MPATTTYGSWTNIVDSTALTLEQTVLEFVSGADHDWITALKNSGALDRIIEDYREAINKALPPGVALSGDEFIGPFEHAQDAWDGYPTTEDGDLDIGAIVEAIDLGAIVARHDPDKQALYTYAIEMSADGQSWSIERIDSEQTAESPDVCARRILVDWLSEFEDTPRYSRCVVWRGDIGDVDQAAAVATTPADYPVVVYWSIVRGPAPDAEAAEPGPLDIPVPDEVLELGARYGLGDDPDVYVLVAPAELAGEIPGELAYYRARMPYSMALRVWEAIDQER
ncbi:MAG UNVERIFIED_CONTAM: hypothetical protein LOD86_00330 [Thermobifida fusca]